MLEVNDHACVTRFVILSAPRSGSNMLSSMLNSHSSVLCHHEIFNPAGLFYALPLRGSQFAVAKNIEERDNNPYACLDNIWRMNENKTCVGFKMTHKQNTAVFYSVLNDKKVKKIILTRKNQVKAHVSKLLAQKTGVWEQYNNSAEPLNRLNDSTKEEHQVLVCPQELKNDINLNKRYYEEIHLCLKESNQAYLDVEYENLKEAWTQQSLLHYLRLENQTLITRNIKQNPSDLRKKISNYSALLEQCPKSLVSQLSETST